MYVYELYKALSETADEPSDVNSQGRDHVLNWLALRPTLSLPPLAVRPPYTLSGPAGACPPPAPPSRAWEESPESARNTIMALAVRALLVARNSGSAEPLVVAGGVRLGSLS